MCILLSVYFSVSSVLVYQFCQYICSFIFLTMFPDDFLYVPFGCGCVALSVLRITTASELIRDVQTGALLPVTSPSHTN